MSVCACASLHAKHRISTFSAIFLISYVIWRHKFKACIFKMTVWCIHFSVLSHIIIYLGLIACGCINRCSHLPVSIARKGKIFLYSSMLVWLREEKGLSESYLVSNLLPTCVRVFFLFFLFLVSVRTFRNLVTLQMPCTWCLLALLTRACFKSRGILSFLQWEEKKKRKIPANCFVK